jgi:DNA-binding MarR family transcriptional regulator
VRITQLVGDRFEAIAGELGVGPREGRLLVVASHGALPVGRLGQVVRAGKSTMTGILSRMVDEGLVTREPDPADRRVALITPTERGRAIAGSLQSRVRAFVLDLLEPLGPAEREQLAALLGVVIARADVVLPPE